MERELSDQQKQILKYSKKLEHEFLDFVGDLVDSGKANKRFSAMARNNMEIAFMCVKEAVTFPEG